VKASVFIATSVDGFIARENGGIDWLPQPDQNSTEDYGYQAFFDSVDALVMGRNTFELALSFGGWPYGDKPVFVLSTRRLEIPLSIAGTVSHLSGTPTEVAQRLRDRGFQHLYIDGGKTIQGFLREGLIQQLTLTRVPVLLGSGIPLFGALAHDVRLTAVETRQYENGLVQTRYQVE
jgi:dihydrofolate reductase